MPLPSILTVAPSGIMNRVTVSGTRPVARTDLILIGIVAAEEAVAKAVDCAGTMCFKYPNGFDFVTKA